MFFILSALAELWIALEDAGDDHAYATRGVAVILPGG